MAKRMALRKKLPSRHHRPEPADFLETVCTWSPGWTATPSRLDSKLARARAQDTPVLYPHFVPGLDILLCAVPGARVPYPSIAELRQRCFENVMHALEQPCARLDNGGCWYEHNGLGMLVFFSGVRERTLEAFGAPHGGGH